VMAEPGLRSGIAAFPAPSLDNSKKRVFGAG
jgi:hypothetical protein